MKLTLAVLVMIGSATSAPAQAPAYNPTKEQLCREQMKQNAKLAGRVGNAPSKEAKRADLKACMSRGRTS
jgi:hypothetical protein